MRAAFSVALIFVGTFGVVLSVVPILTSAAWRVSMWACAAGSLLLLAVGLALRQESMVFVPVGFTAAVLICWGILSWTEPKREAHEDRGEKVAVLLYLIAIPSVAVWLLNAGVSALWGWLRAAGK